MPRPVTGRRPDSLFDNRYRYDHIYPRGRSGETLRAYDTLNGDRPCVIKRPALQDAPPIRAGQELSILNEKRALEQLSGHPVLCELLHSGTFRIGGQQHQYIVIEMASGETLEALTLALAAQGERLPDLELLTVLEGVLDLLQAAHDKRIVYNDVDAKHVFWDREAYQLKMIDWGNAVFLDSDAHTHVTPQTDIAQVGQLLYFLLSGGRRLDLSHPESVNELPESVPARLKAIISRAVSAEPSARYANIAELRRDLAELRRPLHKQREALIERVRARLPHVNSQNQLAELRTWLQEARRADPGYPPARELEAEVERRLNKLQLQADLDAVRIYLESGNFARATDLLDDLLARSTEELHPTLRFLQDACELLGRYTPPLQPEGFGQALDALLRDDPQAAARALLTTPDPRDAARQAQLLLAERLCAHLPIVVLLRPHLARLELLLSNVPQLTRVRQIIARFEETPAEGIQNLLRHYQRIADALLTLEEDLRGMESARETAQRARQTAEALIDLIEVAAQNALGDPSRAGNALWHAQAIDPTSAAFAPLNALLNAFHTDLETLRAYTPALDGSDIADFLSSAAQRLLPYAAEVTDPRFQAILRDLETTSAAWLRVADSIALGGKRPAVEQCKAAASAIRSLSPKTAYWFEEYARRLEESPRVEFLSPNVPFGKALAEGWESWDRGRTADALHSGKRAADYALTEAEKLAARRLISLSEALDTWLERDGATSTPQTEAALRRVSALFLPEEETLRQTFAAQMPTMQTYLKAMSKGVVEPLRDSSAAAVRVLFFEYVLRGILALQREQFDDANLWKEAAAKALPTARNHPAFQTLETAIARRQLVLEAVRALNNLTDVSAIAEARQAVRAPLAATQLESADQAIRALEDALRRWHDGDFRAARSQLDLALERVIGAEIALNKPLDGFKNWLQALADAAEYLAQQRRLIEEEALAPAETPKPEIAEAHQKLVDITRRDLGEPYTAQLRQWRDTYLAVRDLYTDPDLSKDEKLRLFEGHFASLFISRQPALPILRHWRARVERLPDPEPELPRYQASAGVYEASDAPDLAALDAAPAPRRATPRSEPISAPAPADVLPIERRAERPARRETLPLVLIGAFGIVAIIAGLLLLFGGDGADRPPTPSATPVGLGAPISQLATQAPTIAPPTLTLTFTPTFTLTPSATATPEAVVPSPTPLPTGELLSPATLLAALSPSPIPTLSAGASPEPTNPAIALPTLPPDARSGEYDVLAALLTLDEGRRTWDSAWFSYQEGAWIVGNPLRTGGRAPLIRFGPELLTPLFGAEAARYVRRMEVELELVSYEPRLLPTGQVIFGAGMESLQGQRAAVEARLIQEQIANFGINLNGNFLQKTQLPAKPLILRAAIARGADRTLSLYLDGQLLGQSNAAYPSDMPISLYVYTASGGMIVKVNALRVWLQKPE